MMGKNDPLDIAAGYALFAEWAVELGFTGQIARTTFTDCDRAYMTICGHDVMEGDCNYSTAVSFEQKIKEGKCSIEWLRGPNAYALLKMRIAQNPKLQKWFPTVVNEEACKSE